MSKERINQINHFTNPKWTVAEIAQLIIAVVNFGEGEWLEVQKRINFASSGQVKTANQVALKWRSIKRKMLKDTNKINRN